MPREVGARGIAAQPLTAAAPCRPAAVGVAVQAVVVAGEELPLRRAGVGVGVGVGGGVAAGVEEQSRRALSDKGAGPAVATGAVAPSVGVGGGAGEVLRRVLARGGHRLFLDARWAPTRTRARDRRVAGTEGAAAGAVGVAVGEGAGLSGRRDGPCPRRKGEHSVSRSELTEYFCKPPTAVFLLAWLCCSQLRAVVLRLIWRCTYIPAWCVLFCGSYGVFVVIDAWTRGQLFWGGVM